MMCAKKMLIFVVALLLASPVSSQPGSAKTTILRNVNLIDVEQQKLIENVDIAMQADLIVEIGRNISTTGDENEIDLTGRYIIPGIIDAHTHLTMFYSREMLAENLAYLVRHGVTAVRDVGSDARQLAELKRAIGTGESIGPDIYYSAFIAAKEYFSGNMQRIWMKGMPDQEFAPWVQQVMPGDDLDSVMISAKATGATGVKIYLGYDKGFLRQLADAAGKHGLQVWGHAMLYPAMPSEVVSAGMKVLSHAYMLEWEGFENPGGTAKETLGRRSSIDFGKVNLDHFIKVALEHDIILDATMLISEEVKIYPHARAYTKKLNEAGVKIAAGTDWGIDVNSPYPPIYTEIRTLMEVCDFSAMDALRSATIIAAETFRGHKTKGSIALGKDADIVVLRGNPLEDISNLQNIEMVFHRGKKVTTPIDN